MYQQIEEGDYMKAKKLEKTLLDDIHQKLVAQFKSMGLTDFKTKETVFGNCTSYGEYVPFD